MNRFQLRTMVLAGIGLLAAVPTYAHHSFAAEFDATKCQDFNGTLHRRRVAKSPWIFPRGCEEWGRRHRILDVPNRFHHHDEAQRHLAQGSGRKHRQARICTGMPRQERRQESCRGRDHEDERRPDAHRRSGSGARRPSGILTVAERFPEHAATLLARRASGKRYTPRKDPVALRA